MSLFKFLSVSAVALGVAISGQAARAATFDVDFTGADGLGAVTADMVLNVTNGNVVSGTGTITTAVSGNQGWGTASLSFLPAPTSSAVYEFNGGTEFSGDNVYPIDGNGLVFNVGTAAQAGQYQTGGGFIIWSTGGDTYQAGLFDFVGNGHEWEYPVNGTATVTEVSPVPLPGALPLFGMILAGFAAWGYRRRIFKAA